jgi:predicted membrane-bound dolichyl-phosphate-mannose-protein mannosyltransferase
MASDGGTLNDVLNFIIPIIVWALLAYIIYRIPIIKEGIGRLIDWNRNRRENVSNSRSSSSGGTYKTSIGYE